MYLLAAQNQKKMGKKEKRRLGQNESVLLGDSKRVRK